MRPFLLSTLKCTKCESVSIPTLNVEQLKRVSLPGAIPSLELFNNQQEALLNLIASIPQLDGLILPAEADVREYLAGDNINGSVDRLNDILYGLDVVLGNIKCPDCGDKSEIKDGILFLNNK